MEKFDSISQFIQSGGFAYRVYEMGRKIVRLSNPLFQQIEEQSERYPCPFRQKAWLALILWEHGHEDTAVIWFLQFPIDELGFLKQDARDTFLVDLLQQTGKNIQAKQTGITVPDHLAESPFAFKPREDRLAMLHAIASKFLNQPPSRYYAYAHEYLQGKFGLEQWQFLGLQGIADVVSRLDQDDNEVYLADAVSQMPAVPLENFAHALEHVSPHEQLAEVLVVRLEQELAAQNPDVKILSALLRAMSGCEHEAVRKNLLFRVLGSTSGAEIEVLAAISGRSWNDLLDSNLMELFIDKLAQNDQTAFNAILVDLMIIPDMREAVLGVLNRPKRAPELSSRITGFMQVVGVG